MLKYLILNIDLSQIDTGYLVPICLDYHLYTPLIYICNRADDDFITPLNKLFAHIKLSEEREEATKPHLVLKLFWYIQLCLKGTMFPEEPLSLKK